MPSSQQCRTASEWHEMLMSDDVDIALFEKHLMECEACRQVFASVLENDSIVSAIESSLRHYDLPKPPSRRMQEKIESLIDTHLSRLSDNTAVLKVDDSAKLSGRRIGNFEVQRKLGSGGMGTVYLAKDLRLQRAVALKVLNAKFKDHRQYLERFLREATLAASVRHSGVAMIFEVGEHEGNPFIAMELLEGANLHDYLRQNPQLPIDQILHISKQILAALAAAHNKGVLHRDIKPGNIWLEEIESKHPVVKLLDFGLARLELVEDGLTKTGEVLGTPAYMSPEQFSGTGVDRRTDLYAVGCVMYQMITGRTPHAGKSTMQLIQAIALEKPLPINRFRKDVPRTLSRLIERLLSPDANDRPSDCKEVIVLLDEIADQEEGNKGQNRTATVGNLLSYVVSLGSGNVWLKWTAIAAGGFIVLLLAIVTLIIRHKDGTETQLTYDSNDVASIEVKGSPNDAMPLSTNSSTDGKAGWYNWPAGCPAPAKAPFDATQAKSYQTAWAVYLGVPVEFVDAFGQRFRLIPPGEFMMGSTLEEVQKVQAEMKAFAESKPEQHLASQGKDMHLTLVATEYPQRRITITEPFYLAINEITVSQWAKFAETGYLTDSEREGYGEAWGMAGQMITAAPGTSWRTYYESVMPDRAARELSWNDIEAYAKYLSQETSMFYRMPSEAEWEFACRAGTTTRYYYGDTLTSDNAELRTESGAGKVQSVRSFQPNAFGIYDMHGSISEWCLDSGASTAASATQTVNPVNRVESEYRILKGNQSPRVQTNRSACRIPQPKSGRTIQSGGRLTLSMRSVQERTRMQQ